MRILFIRAVLLGVFLSGPVPTVSGQEAAPAASNRSDIGRLEAWMGPVRFGALVIDPEIRLDSDWRRSKPASANEADHDLALSGKRIGLNGRVGKRFGFEVSADFTSSNPWRNVRADYRLPAGVTITGGQFKVPFSMDGHRSAVERDFLFRSRLADAFSMGRDRGFALETRVWRKRVTIEGGVFARDGNRVGKDAELRTGSRLTGAGRVTVTPWSRRGGLLKDVRVGASTASSRLDEGRSELTLRTVAGQELTSPLYWARGTRTRTGVDLRWRPGRFSLAAEYLRVADQRQGQGNGNEDLAPLAGAGWFIEGSWLLTGENKSKNLRPTHSLLAGGPGALEVVGRLERAQLGDRGVSAVMAGSPRATNTALSRVRVLTTGVNWYPVTGARVQVNLISETFAGATTSSLRALSSTLTTAVRFQLFL